jgi:Lon protease-like protein
MSDEGTQIAVNFAKPFPLFPLHQVVLLPQQIRPLHIFEPRYKQMITRALDGSGQIAMAVYEGDAWKLQHHGRPPVLPAVCIGQIVEHEKLSEGRYNLVVQGVCRAKIARELPASEDRLYREGILEPVGADEIDASQLSDVREKLHELFVDGPLMQLKAGKPLAECLQRDQFPTAAILELVSFTVVSDPKLRYRLLAEGDASIRSRMILSELQHIRRLVSKATAQHPEKWPKGCSWN